MDELESEWWMKGTLFSPDNPPMALWSTRLKPISVVFTLPEQALRQVQGQNSAGEMTVLAVDRDNKTILDERKFTVIDNQIDTSTGTIRMKTTCQTQSSCFGLDSW